MRLSNSCVSRGFFVLKFGFWGVRSPRNTPNDMQVSYFATVSMSVLPYQGVQFYTSFPRFNMSDNSKGFGWVESRYSQLNQLRNLRIMGRLTPTANLRWSLVRQLISLLLGLEQFTRHFIISKRTATVANLEDLRYDLKVFPEVCSDVSGYLACVLAEKALYATVLQRRNLQVSSSATVSNSPTSTDVFPKFSEKSSL